ncbi:flagellar hook-length control protein FliK [Bradyrhizobium sp. BRP22]|uniref:flagellar hook-length control protein FliK n=1 Tax=Bradyrhizobium sp. BRP22 TaxID=2793821 RepID=UPI001CD4F9B7|nr:flagellar hook-length control protein FliK [Bradyrhizobium sp. BRP22]MCA1456005.1 flagellar hook-length control protein FliK [Bradyrhizobium sp. BRP22]
MALTINPVLPVLSAEEVGSVAPELVLQPGSVINAQVLKVLSADLVRIAISSLSIDVLSEVPLKEGQALQLAVSQTKDGIRLAMLGQGDAAADDAVTLSPDAQRAAANPSTTAEPRNVLTPVDRAAVTNAAQNAATVQRSLAPLFANLGALAAAGNLPPKLQQAIAQVLAQQTPLDQNLDGGDIKNAFERSGLFFEASLGAGTTPSSASVPDLKAALIVLRQALQSSLGAPHAAPQAAASTAGQVAARSALTSSLAPSDIEVEEILLPQARVPVADDLLTSGVIGRGTSNATSSAGATLNLMQELGSSARPNAIASDVTAHTNTPPPPFRGALPAAQPIALPSLAPDAPLATAAHHLLGDTDAALARQTLLQVASLPDRIDIANPQIDTSSSRWHFEIPFATPQGTAMAQFEISRDGGGVEAEMAKRVWRARFSLEVEPAGPVHALISLVGDKTSVRMWAERPATAAQLRAGAPQLSQALSRAELLPGDIVIQDGAPPQATPARAGHFLDRAL